MKVKENKHNYKLIIGFVLGVIITLSVGVYATTLLASDIQYTNNDQENVQGAIDDLYDKSEKHCPINKTCINKENAKGLFPICKRATELHTEKCNSSNDVGCKAAGYATNATITYGQLGTSGTLSSGDAFDCDVNLDGTYDADKERFYYVSEYYNTESKEFENDRVILIYYNNISSGLPNNILAYEYYSEKSNSLGPVTAKEQLPTTNQWSNVSLKNTSRTILNEKGEIATNDGVTTLFSYEGYAARLLTVSEVNVACGITVGSYKVGELNNCQYLMENTIFSNSRYKYGYWLETFRSNSSDLVWYVRGNDRDVNNLDVDHTSNIGVRPVIEVSLSDIAY